MYQVARHLKDFHSLGYVHLDLTPGNVIWLPSEARWGVVKFGCAAPIGAEARMPSNLSYAAPEVIAAYRRRDTSIIAQVRCLSAQESSTVRGCLSCSFVVLPMADGYLVVAQTTAPFSACLHMMRSFVAMQEAVDVWSLGVMAFELLTGEPALTMNSGLAKVRHPSPHILTLLHRAHLCSRAQNLEVRSLDVPGSTIDMICVVMGARSWSRVRDPLWHRHLLSTCNVETGQNSVLDQAPSEEGPPPYRVHQERRCILCTCMSCGTMGDV